MGRVLSFKRAAEAACQTDDANASAFLPFRPQSKGHALLEIYSCFSNKLEFARRGWIALMADRRYSPYALYTMHFS